MPDGPLRSSDKTQDILITVKMSRICDSEAYTGSGLYCIDQIKYCIDLKAF